MNENQEPNEVERPVNLRFVVWFFALLILYAFARHAVVDMWRFGYEGGDFSIYYVAAERISEGNSPYPIEQIESYDGTGPSPIWGEYPYPPILARLLVPVTGYPVFTAKWIYTGTLLAIFLALAFVLFRMYRPMLSFSDFLPIWATLFGWGPFIYSIRLGQCELLAMPFLALAWILLLQGERNPRRKEILEIAAGMAMGFAAMVRLTPVLMIPVFFVTFRWRIVLSFIAGSILALFLSGPQSSWEFLTQVLPTMSDVSSMREVPAVHVLVLRTLDTLSGSEPWIGPDRTAAVLGTATFYLAVLGVLFWRRLRFSTLDLFILACFLPPLLAGKNPHHYALALFPIVLGSVLIVREALDKEPAFYRVRMIFWILILLPAFNYWPPSNGFIDWVDTVGPFSRTTLFVLGNLIAFGLVIHLLDRKTFLHREKVDSEPLQP